MTGSHRYGTGAGCMYCRAPGSESGQPCAIAVEVEHDYTWRIGSGYDAVQHLGMLVGKLQRRDNGGWKVEHSATNEGTPRERYTVSHDGAVVVQVQGVVRELVAREVVALLWARRK